MAPDDTPTVLKPPSETERRLGRELHEAISKGIQGVPQALELIEQGASVYELDDLGRTPLLRAALSNRRSIVGSLLAAGADPNLPGKDGETPLILAMRGSCTRVAKMLIDAGADIHQRNAGGKTAADCARERKRPQHADLMEAWSQKASERRHVAGWAAAGLPLDHDLAVRKPLRFKTPGQC